MTLKSRLHRCAAETRTAARCSRAGRYRLVGNGGQGIPNSELLCMLHAKKRLEVLKHQSKGLGYNTYRIIQIEASHRKPRKKRR